MATCLMVSRRCSSHGPLGLLENVCGPCTQGVALGFRVFRRWRKRTARWAGMVGIRGWAQQ